jgi:hypothetical protein
MSRYKSDRPPQSKPTHYKVICISMYTEDMHRLDTMVDELKSRGLTRMSRSALIRIALDETSVDDVERVWRKLHSASAQPQPSSF